MTRRCATCGEVRRTSPFMERLLVKTGKPYTCSIRCELALARKP